MLDISTLDSIYKYKNRTFSKKVLRLSLSKKGFAKYTRGFTSIGTQNDSGHLMITTVVQSLTNQFTTYFFASLLKYSFPHKLEGNGQSFVGAPPGRHSRLAVPCITPPSTADNSFFSSFSFSIFRFFQKTSRIPIKCAHEVHF